MIRSLSAWLRGGSNRPGVWLGVFGKHPAWDDHIDDIGLETQRLVEVKRSLYTRGLTDAFDSGAWDRLEERDRLPGFSHTLVWRWPGDVVVARMWSSKDGKGRTRYPMIAAVQASGLPHDRAVAVSIAALAPLERRCATASSQASVRSSVAETLNSLREQLGVSPGSDPADPDPAGLALVSAWASGAPREAFPRIVHHLAASAGGTGAIHFRGAMVGTREGASACAWIAAAMGVLGVQRVLRDGVLAVEARDAGLVDLIIGEASPSSLRCLRSARSVEPMTQDVPYTLSAGIISKADGLLTDWAGRG
ncbi:MAG: hypothetical protein HRU70_05600 [Phycisphaeraceae bacterium]|nr:MAG: hypothetical protein HRU70_05600 [Phycisphaeraceae bacterium]